MESGIRSFFENKAVLAKPSGAGDAARLAIRSQCSFRGASLRPRRVLRLEFPRRHPGSTSASFPSPSPHGNQPHADAADAAPTGKRHDPSQAAQSAAGAAAYPLAPEPSDAPKPRSRKYSDALWPALGAALSFCGLAALDHMLAPRKLSMSLASFAAVSSVLFVLPAQAPVAKRERILVSHLGCALIGVALLAALGHSPWLARSIAVGLSIAFMQLTDCFHPPAAGLPVIFIDGVKFHHLQWWYPLFPCVAGCLWLFVMQEMVQRAKGMWQF